MAGGSNVNASLRGSMVTYIVGFGGSLLLTLAAYFMVVERLLTGNALVAALISLAMTQLVVQLLCFLHLGNESRPRWNTIAFLFAGLVVLIVVIGSLWIMYNLDYNMAAPPEIDKQVMDEEGIYR